MKGTLKAKSIQDYALIDEKGREVYSFTVVDVKKRKLLDRLQGKVVSVENIKKMV